ncbi:MAG: trehalose-phosphatase [Chloroflexota bacterium]
MTDQTFDAALNAALVVLRRAPAGLFTDVDGTISPIVVDPADARVPHSVKVALRKLRGQIDTVGVVSGRAARDARRMVGVGGLTYIGNHGMEYQRGRHLSVDLSVQPFLPRIHTCIQDLATHLQHPGVVVEDKQMSATIHYRNAAYPEQARATIHAAIQRCTTCQDLHIADGRMVVNLLPPVQVNKGTAIMRIAERRRLQGIVYLGDDVTDLDGFAALRQLRALGKHTLAIAVASPEGPRELVAQADAVIDSVEAAASLFDGLSGQELRVSD